jgi:hypothetical protein
VACTDIPGTFDCNQVMDCFKKEVTSVRRKMLDYEIGRAPNSNACARWLLDECIRKKLWTGIPTSPPLPCQCQNGAPGYDMDLYTGNLVENERVR